MKIREEGDSAILALWPGVPADETRARILSLHARCLAAGKAWLRESIPGRASLLIEFDPRAARPEMVRDLIDALGSEPAKAPTEREVEIPVKYGGPEGPDLDRVSRQSGLSPPEIIRRHAEGAYQVAFLGFAPGFPYLAGLPAALATPRLDAPRARVPAGSVALAGDLSGIYPRQSPGGWNIIGRTPAALCDWEREEPFLLRPGDRVRFRPVPSADFPSAEHDPAPSDPDHPVIAVEKTGLLASVQDLGRPGHAHLGVPPSGAMDALAFRLANLAAGNRGDLPAMELAFPGPRIRFLARISFALGGADFTARLDGRPVPHYLRLEARAGETLSFESHRSGQWAYLALAGGIAARRFLGSASVDFRSGLSGPLGDGARLSLAGPPAPDGRPVPRELAAIPPDGAAARVIVVEGTPPASLDGAMVSLSPVRDRSGYRASSPVFPGGSGLADPEGIPPGTIQLPPDGLPIFLLAERPTTGGYRKLGFLASTSRRVIAQSLPGSKVKLEVISAAEARRLLAEESAAFDTL